MCVSVKGEKPVTCLQLSQETTLGITSVFAWSASTLICMIYDAPLNVGLDLTFHPIRGFILYYNNLPGKYCKHRSIQVYIVLMQLTIILQLSVVFIKHTQTKNSMLRITRKTGQ